MLTDKRAKVCGLSVKHGCNKAAIAFETESGK